MGSYQNPITPRDPYDRYHIDPGDRERHSRTGHEAAGAQSGSAAYFLKLSHRILTVLDSSEKRRERKAQGSLRSLKDAFEIVKREDRIEDIACLKDLSQT